MSILGKLMGTAETAARSSARGGRTTARPARGMGRTTARSGMARGGVGRGGVGRGGLGRGRATPATSGGIGRLVEGFLRRR